MRSGTRRYGKMHEIDHDSNGLVAGYANAPELAVEQSAPVVRGQRVATVGSIGRPTGFHLDFEVRQNGLPQNPARFLRAGDPYQR